jgi:broad specificity phosphatase PhoE
MTAVFLIRHGSTAVNRQTPYRLQGRKLDVGLDTAGAEQARRTAAALAGFALAAVYSSPLLRALETAAAVARPHALEPVAIPDLIEADLGRWEGLTWAEAGEHDPEHYQLFQAHPGTVPYPNGESFLDVQKRVLPLINSLAAAHPGQNIVVLGHNVVNRAYLAGILGLPIDLARPLRQANGGINVVRYQGPKAQLETLNAWFHLGDLAPT